MAWWIIFNFINDPHTAFLSLFYFAMTYKIGYKGHYKGGYGEGQQTIFFYLWLFPAIFMLIFIPVSLILIWLFPS
jgi:hypothetical protein